MAEATLKKRLARGQIELAVGVTVRTEAMKRLGWWAPDKSEIVLNPKQPHIGIDITFLHELLHCVDDQMVAAGIVKRRVPHAWIESAAMNLLWLLVEADLWRGITRRQVRTFVDRYVPDAPKRKKRKA